MAQPLEFPVLLRLIDERSTAFRAAVRSASDLVLPVPTCPEWTLLELVHHLGAVHRRWAGVVSTGPAAEAPPKATAAGAPADRDALLDWSAASTRQLLDALREAGPDRECWTWWGEMSESPGNSGAVARHQVQEATVHTYDAQVSVGAAQPLPDEVALDGVDEFLATCVSGPFPWPHQPALLDFHVAGGPTWRLSLSADGAWTRKPVTGEEPDAAIRGTPGELVLMFYSRIPIGSLKVDGDLHRLEQLRDWEP